MNVSLEWLGDFLPGELSPERAAEALTHGGFPVESITRHGADTVLDVEVTSNRGDCLSHIGVAKELAALLDRTVTVKHQPPAEAGGPAKELISVAIDNTKLCPHYIARVITRGVPKLSGWI